MTEGIRILNLTVAVMGFTVSIIGLAQILYSRYLKKETRSFFVAFFCVLITYVFFILIRALTYYHTDPMWASVSRVAFFLQAFLSSVLTVLITGFLLYRSGEQKWYINPFFCTSFGLWCVYSAILIYAQFTDAIYYVNDDNSYHRGPFFAILMVAPVIIMVINLIALYTKRDSLSKKEKTAFFIYAAVPLLAMFLQTVLFGIQFIVLGTSVGGLLMFAYIDMEQRDEYYRQERENDRLKTDILLAQIHPHFMFNSLTTIRYLCKDDPKKAAEAITEFIAYLRAHMDSITIDSPISFSDELNLVQEYLSLQMLRYGDDLSVGYDLRYMDFTLPTLTLQPLVENAVIHGVRGSKTGRGKVMIRTSLKEDHVELEVEDDGEGFSPDELPDDGNSHTGIENVRERLYLVSKGELRFETGSKGGTRAIIILPMET